MTDNTTFVRRPATILNDYKYPMPASTKPVEGAKYPATWNWEISAKGNKIFMKINDGIYGKDDQNAKLKEVELNHFDRNALLHVLESACEDKDFTSSQVEIKAFLWNRQTNRKNDTPTTLAVLTVIRGKTGEIRVHYKRSTYEVTFSMRSNLLVIKTKNENGEYVDDPGMSSRAYTKAFVDFSRKFLDIEEWNRYARAEKPTSNTSNNTNSNTQSQNNTSAEFDDDFDF